MRQRPHQDAILAICHKTYILSSSMLKLLTCCKNSEKKLYKKEKLCELFDFMPIFQ